MARARDRRGLIVIGVFSKQIGANVVPIALHTVEFWFPRHTNLKQKSQIQQIWNAMREP